MSCGHVGPVPDSIVRICKYVNEVSAVLSHKG